MNVGFLPRVLPTAPSGRLSLGRVGLTRPRTAELPAAPETVATADDAALAAGPRKRRRNPTLHVDLRPATSASNPIARLWASSLAIAASLRSRVATIELPSAAATRLAPLTERLGRGRSAGAEVAAARPALQLPASLTAALAPVARVDLRVLAILGVLATAAIYGVTVAEPPAAQQVAAAERALLPPAKPDTAAAAGTPDALPADPFSQKSINTELRSLRKALEPGDQARSLTVLPDGTMGMNIVNGGMTANVMVRGQDIAIEPLAADAAADGASLDLQRVHGTAITRFLNAAAATRQLPQAKLGSLRLIENSAKPGTFIWIGVWNDPARTTLYADREANTISTARPR